MQPNSGEQEYAFRIGINRIDGDDLLEVEVGGVKLNVLADSGTQSNSVDENTWEMLKAKNINLNVHLKLPHQISTSILMHKKLH
jgi:hypothetical protein